MIPSNYIFFLLQIILSDLEPFSYHCKSYRIQHFLCSQEMHSAHMKYGITKIRVKGYFLGLTFLLLHVYKDHKTLVYYLLGDLIVLLFTRQCSLLNRRC